MKRNKTRAQKSKKLLNLIKRFYKNSTKPSSKPPLKPFLPWKTLLLTTIVHCYDSYLVQGKNFLADESSLCQTFNIEKTLKKMADRTFFDSRRNGNTLAASLTAKKIREKKILKISDILKNPFDYR
jgi:hypothetical protein